MFTGLIEKVGELVELAQAGELWRIAVRHDPWETPLAEGESVAVQGACLTVAAVERGLFRCSVLGETLDRTTLGSRAVGSLLNLERALKFGDRLGGHLVSGHVDGTGIVRRAQREGPDRVLRVVCEPSIADGIVLKGSVALDGVSLTVTALTQDSFDVHIIPFTWEHTSLRSLRPGDAVNLETDLFGKYVARYVRGSSSQRGIGVEDLIRTGFA